LKSELPGKKGEKTRKKAREITGKPANRPLRMIAKIGRLCIIRRGPITADTDDDERRDCLAGADGGTIAALVAPQCRIREYTVACHAGRGVE
jgi:hypothetical protein